MDAEIHHAAAARERAGRRTTACPARRRCGTRGRPRRRARARRERTSSRMRRMPVGEAVREIDAEQPVRRAGGVDHRARLRRPCGPSGFWQNTATPALQRADRLLGMQRARRGDHHAVERQRRAWSSSDRDELRVRARARPPLPPSRATGSAIAADFDRAGRRGSPPCGGGRSSRRRESRARARRRGVDRRVIAGHQSLQEAVRPVARRVERLAEPVEREGVGVERGSGRAGRRRRPPRPRACPAT